MEPIQSFYSLDMGQIESIYGMRAGIIWGVLFAFGLFYAWLVYDYLPSTGIKNRTAELVVGGVLVTLMGYGLILGNASVRGGDALVVALICFACSGVPMIVGYWSKDAEHAAEEQKRKEDDAQRAKEQISKRANKFAVKKDK